MKIQNLVETIFLLLSKEKVSAKYLSERFNVSIRSVYRYIDDLSLTIPIFNVRGRNGGFSISDDFKISSTYLTKEEKSTLLNIIAGVKNEVSSPIIERLFDKISSISKVRSTNLNVNFGNLIIDGSAWGNSESYKEKLTIIEECIENKSSLLIGYQDRDGQVSEREIEPHTLILKQGLWYCYAYCHLRNTFRLFKVGRIEKMKILPKNFERRETSNLKGLLNEWYSTLNSQNVELLVDKTIKSDVEEWLGVDKVITMPNGEIKINTPIPLDDVLVSKILSFGNKIKVLSPQTLKNSVLEMANQVIKNYS